MSYGSYEVPDGIEPLIGYRGWVVSGGRLFSCYRKVEWPVGGSLASECLDPTYVLLNDRGSDIPPPPKHYVSPDARCTCGVYAMHEYPRDWEVFEGERRAVMKPWWPGAVTGIVKAWGKIIVGSKGFRAQYVEPIALVSQRRSGRWPKVIEELAEAYGMEVISVKEVRGRP